MSKKLTPREIIDLPASDLISKICHEKLSVLDSIGCHKYRKETRIPGMAMSVILAVTRLTSGSMSNYRNRCKAKERLVKFLSRWAPYTLKGDLPDSKDGVVLAFNHPSLGEIIRLLALAMDTYPTEHLLFPVTLPWFEAFAPCYDWLAEIGIDILPTITPAFEYKARSISNEAEATVKAIANKLNDHYMKSVIEHLQCGYVVLVAPSATRQKHVFVNLDQYEARETIRPAPISVLTFATHRAKCDDSLLVPIGVVPPEGFSKGLNLRKDYVFGIGEILDVADAFSLVQTRSNSNKSVRMLECDFLHRIADVVNANGGSGLICPYNYMDEL